MARPAGLVVAGGRSRRMGANKALLPWPPGSEGTMIGAVCETLQRVASRVVIASGRPGTLPAQRWPLIPDEVPDAGPLAGIHAGLAALWRTREEEGEEGALVVACDLPFLRPNLLQALADRADGVDAVVPLRPDGRPEPLVAYYAYAALPVIGRRLRGGGGRVDAILQELRVAYLPADLCRRYDEELLSFTNVNTPEAYAAARERAARKAHPLTARAAPAPADRRQGERPAPPPVGR